MCTLLVAVRKLGHRVLSCGLVIACVADYAELSYAIIRRRWLASWQMAETCALLLLLARLALRRGKAFDADKRQYKREVVVVP